MSSLRIRAKQKGFTLLEVLVAFSILAISVGVTLNIFSRGLQSAIVSDEYVHAVTIAQSLLARTGTEIALQDNAISGEEQGFQWFVRIMPYLTEASSAGQDQQQQNLALYEVVVEVAWQEETENRSLVLTTLRLAAAS